MNQEPWSYRNAVFFVAMISLGLAVSCTGQISEPSGYRSDVGPGNAESAGLPGRDLAATIGVRRLSIPQYNNTVRDLLGETGSPATGRLPPDARKPFDTYRAQDSQIGDPLIQAVAGIAGDLASSLIRDTPRRDSIIGCSPASDPNCLQDFVKRFGRRALRRPLTDSDVQLYLQIPVSSGTAGDFYASVEDIVRAFLQDVEFIHRIEIGTPVANSAGLYKLDRWALASRLSYFLWDSMPPDWLFDHVEKENGLLTSADVQGVARRLLADPRARDQAASFHALWLGYADLAQSSYPGPDMLNESSALVSKIIFDDKRPWQDLLRSTGTIVSYDLAKHYGLTKLPAGFSKTSKPAWVSYEGTTRQGILSQGSILHYGTSFGDTSPVLRGKAIVERLFCRTIGKPPPELKVKTDEAPKPAVDNSLCKWNRYQPMVTQAACSGCHRQMNPIGFGLENFDATGAYRTLQYWKKDPTTNLPVLATGPGPGVEKCDPIRSDGEINGQHFSGPAELSDLLLGNSAELANCVLKKLYQFTTGRGELDAADDQAIGAFAARTGGKDFEFAERLLDIVTSEAFAYRRVEN